MKQLMARLAAFVLVLTVAGAGLGGAAMAQDGAGDWHGLLSITPTAQLRVVLHLKPGAAGGLDGAFDSPDQSVFDIPLSDVAVKDGQLTFAAPSLKATFAGTWDGAAHAWTGAWSQGGRDFPIAFTAGGVAPAPTAAGLDGEWDGTLSMGTGLYLRLAFHIATGPHGTLATMDSVDQGAYGAPVTAVSRDGDHVRIEMKAIGAVFEGQYAADGPRLAGVFTQGGAPIPLVLKRLPPGQPSPWPKPAGAAGPLPAPPAKWQTPSDTEIRALLAERIDAERQGVGIVVGVVDATGRRIVAYGKTDSDSGRPLDGDTEFEIGSITKVFTGLTLADMADKGEVRLGDPIEKYLPPGVKAPTFAGQSITLADLATHTSGLPRVPANLYAGNKDPANPYADYTYGQLWAFLSSYQLTRAPGAEWAYSNLGFGLLGDLLARRAGTDFETLVKARVIGPLGMASTAITLTSDERARLATGHDSSLRKVLNWDLPTLAGAGALRSTANDLMTFLAAEMGLAPSPLQQAMATALSVRRSSTSPAMEQALGWEVLRLPTGDIVQHGGGTGGYHTYVAYSPKRRVGVVILTNAETPAGADDIGLHILVGAPVVRLPPPPPPPPERHAVTLDAKALDALTGRYQLSPQATVTVTRDGARLLAQITGQPAYEVFPESPTAVFWKVVDAQMTFALGPDGRATGATLHQAGRDLPAPRIP
jgi:CubicO group peptidase (beta-lactamase class C family)